MNIYNAGNSAQPWVRTRSLVGDAGIEKLQNSHVLVAGLGGVGSYAAEALVRGGIGRLSLIDGDVVASSNLNRQLYALQSTLGQLKTEVAAARIAEINPHCRLKAEPRWITPENASAFLQENPNWVLDAIDDLPAKAALIAAAVEAGILIVSVLGTGNRIEPFAQFTLADLSKTHTCPLARALRRQLRSYGINQGVPVIFSALPPQRPLALGDNEDTDTDGDGDTGIEPIATKKRQPPGSISYLPGQAGLLAAGVIIAALLRDVQER